MLKGVKNHVEYIPNSSLFNIFIFGNLNQLTQQNKKILANIVNNIILLNLQLQDQKIFIEIHFMTSYFEYYNEESARIERIEQSIIPFENIFTTYCNKGNTNIIFLSGHGDIYQRPLLSTVHDVPDMYTIRTSDMNTFKYPLVGLSYFDLHSLHSLDIKINIYYLIDKINILNHIGDKNYIIIPETCHASNFFNYQQDNSSVLRNLILTNVEGIVPMACGKRDLSHKRASSILISLLTIDSKELKYVTDNVKTEKLEIKKSTN